MFCSFILSFIFFQVILSHFSIKTEMAKIGAIQDFDGNHEFVMTMNEDELRQLHDVIHHLNQPLNLLADLADEPGHVLGLGDTVADDFRIAGDGLQRGL